MKSYNDNLAGMTLLANPYNLFGRLPGPQNPLSDIFHKAIMLVVQHGKHGSMGFVLNKTMKEHSLKNVFELQDSQVKDKRVPIHLGGPTELNRFFIIHSPEYTKYLAHSSTYFSNADFAISANHEIVQDILAGCGPKHYMVVLGYTVWEPGELEREIADNRWIICHTDGSMFAQGDSQTKWHNALLKVGVSEYNLSPWIANC